MYASLVRPYSLAPSDLDLYLEKGWFRLGKNLFTTSFLTFQETLFDAFWLRIALDSFEPSRSQKEILKKTSAFRVEEGVFEWTEEKEALFQKYREGVSFQPAPHLEGVVPETGNLFDSREICLYDGDRLIACGVFDLGETAAEGIISFFDPEYRRLSPGKALMLRKMLFCKEKGLTWFYPGYVVPGYPRFDYKLDVSREHSEYFDLTDGEWRNIRELELKKQPLARMVAALVHLEGILHSSGFEDFSLKRYRFYDIVLDSAYTDYDLMTYPYFIHCFANSGVEEVVIVYDTFAGMYRLVMCHKVFRITMPPDELYYSEYLLHETRVIFSEGNPFNFAFGLHELLKRRVNVVK